MGRRSPTHTKNARTDHAFVSGVVGRDRAHPHLAALRDDRVARKIVIPSRAVAVRQPREACRHVRTRPRARSRLSCRLPLAAALHRLHDHARDAARIQRPARDTHRGAVTRRVRVRCIDRTERSPLRLQGAGVLDSAGAREQHDGRVDGVAKSQVIRRGLLRFDLVPRRGRDLRLDDGVAAEVNCEAIVGALHRRAVAARREGVGRDSGRPSCAVGDLGREELDRRVEAAPVDVCAAQVVREVQQEDRVATIGIVLPDLLCEALDDLPGHLSRRAPACARTVACQAMSRAHAIDTATR